eukprot:3596802-Prymnesium_polylepis.1
MECRGADRSVARVRCGLCVWGGWRAHCCEGRRKERRRSRGGVGRGRDRGRRRAGECHDMEGGA